MDNQTTLVLGIFIAGILVSVLIGFNSNMIGFAVQNENVFLRNLPTSANAGEIFYVTYSPVNADAFEVQIKDSVSGECEFLYSGKNFEKIIDYSPENEGTRGTFEVQALSEGSCEFRGSYVIDGEMRNFEDKIVEIK